MSSRFVTSSVTSVVRVAPPPPPPPRVSTPSSLHARLSSISLSPPDNTSPLHLSFPSGGDLFIWLGAAMVFACVLCACIPRTLDAMRKQNRLPPRRHHRCEIPEPLHVCCHVHNGHAAAPRAVAAVEKTSPTGARGWLRRTKQRVSWTAVVINVLLLANQQIQLF